MEDELEFVCKDDDGDWYFDAKNAQYKRIKRGELRAKIKGKSLPDPYLLDEARKKINPKAPSPSKATFALWEHWKVGPLNCVMFVTTYGEGKDAE